MENQKGNTNDVYCIYNQILSQNTLVLGSNPNRITFYVISRKLDNGFLLFFIQNQLYSYLHYIASNNYLFPKNLKMYYKCTTPLYYRITY